MYIGIGSNVRPELNLRKTAVLLRKHWPSVRFSAVYRCAPMERGDQSDFLNAVALAETNESPQFIHDFLQSIERKLKKAPPFRFGPRTIDLDLLLYGQEILPSAEAWQRRLSLIAYRLSLVIPHPKMHLRRFVLEPLCELLNPETPHPVFRRPLGSLLAEVKDQQCVKTDLLL